MLFKTLSFGEKVITTFTFTYIATFAFYYLLAKNYECLWYVATLVFLFTLILLTLPRTNFDQVILWSLSLWGFAHMAGGGVRFGGAVLYKFQIWHLVEVGDSLVLRFDQVVHFFGFAVASLVFFHLLRPYLHYTVNWAVLYVLIIVGGSGLGAINEVIEFVAVVLFRQTGVGGYYNTALDLVFNLLGSIVGVLFVHYYYRPRVRLINQTIT